MLFDPQSFPGSIEYFPKYQGGGGLPNPQGEDMGYMGHKRGAHQPTRGWCAPHPPPFLRGGGRKGGPGRKGKEKPPLLFPPGAPDNFGGAASGEGGYALLNATYFPYTPTQNNLHYT